MKPFHRRSLRGSALLFSSLACTAIAAPATPPVAAQDAAFNPIAFFAPLQLPVPATAIRDGAGKPGPLFWQNRADYDLHATIDPATHTLTGEATISYTNHSPDALDVLWLQLDQNIYRADSRAASARSPRPGRTPQYNDGITIASVEVEQGGKRSKADFLVDDTRMRVDLPTAVKAVDGSIKLHVTYRYTVPGTWGGRTAVTPTRNGDIYEIAQWYPRMAVYDDLRGWDTQPYLGSEFYLEYGSFDYAVTVPWNYVVAGSGELTNPKEVLTAQQQQRLQQARGSDKTVYIVRPEEVGQAATRPRQAGTQTWHFHMEHSRDVAFAASPAFVWDAARINLPEGKQSLAMSVYAAEGVGPDKWDRSTEYLKGAIEHFSSKWYPYPWPVAVNLGGHGAGMEYPGIVFDGFEDDKDKLFWITAHEIGHSWFPMIVGSNERRHAFMDEGFNTFIDVYASDAFNNGEYGPKRDGEYAPKGGNPVDEILPVLADTDAPTLMHIADGTSEKYRHPVTYFKGALGLVLLREQILGPARFDPAFRKYIATWAYKHPDPSDFFRFMESESGEDLSWWWRAWYFNNWQLDMGISSARYADDSHTGIVVALESRQKMVMPATLRIDYTDGSHDDRRIPVEAWIQRSAPEVAFPTTKPVARVTLDPDHKLPDADRGNNTASIGG
ncbi:M1 family metallopeptidase [Pseudoxanthomonas sp.]|uniref:M1 family metallopeptidase n=1 Tax=Pseudoxanthomonas sp. TaxID=1871049 RepID=UPI002609D46A|nr:M1 family metallopeptidase [Pseudoxanthomonas sp.]WDS37462.1 MAG: M1 family metallopeptidase [Pseudoxanthomonas sp.]